MSQGRTMRTLNPSESPIKERYAMLVGTVAPLAHCIGQHSRR